MRPLGLAAVVVCSFLLLSLLLSGCGGGSTNSSHPSTPIFTSTPVTGGEQGVAYTYQIAATDPAGGSVTFALTTGPMGATLSGSALNWTPTAAESRVSNNFTVTATTTSGGTAQQSWMVSPNGTITVNWVNTYWSPSGPVQVPAPASAANDIEALVPQADGSITLLKGSATSTAGVFAIPDVPAGNYWLAAGGGGAFWTSTATFDAGNDVAGGEQSFTTSSNETTFNYDVNGVAPETTEEWVEYFTDPPTGAVLFGVAPGETSLSGGIVSSSYIDWTQINNAFLMQYELETLGLWDSYVLGPELTLSDLAFVNGAMNNISGTLNAAANNGSLNLSVSGSQWVSLWNTAGPATVTPLASALVLTAEPYVTGVNANQVSSITPGLVLAAPSAGALGFLVEQGVVLINPLASNCGDFTGDSTTNVVAIQQPIVTDQNIGTLSYSDPFDSTWTRTMGFCEQATVPLPIPNSSATYEFLLVNGAITAPSSSTVVPIALPVASPMINGSSLWTATTINTTAPSLSWTVPGGSTPYGYKVRVFIQTTLNGQPVYVVTATYSTSSSSITLPPLAGGNTYVFTITTEVDGRTNVQTSPYRSQLPTGFSNIVSAPITISGAATGQTIRGDLEEWNRVVKPKQNAQGRALSARPALTSCGLRGHAPLLAICE